MLYSKDAAAIRRCENIFFSANMERGNIAASNSQLEIKMTQQEMINRDRRGQDLTTLLILIVFSYVRRIP